MRRVPPFVAGMGAGLLFCLGGCAHAPPVASTPAHEPQVPVTHVDTGEAYGLLLSAAGCWFGGVWSQAEGEELRADRKAQTEAHCRDVLGAVYGPAGAGDAVRMRQLRAVEESVVADVAEKLGMLAGADADKRDLRVLLLALAPAMRENLFARRAADKVHRDLDDERPIEKLGEDETAAVEPLSAHDAVDALVALQAGSFTPDAHALGVLAAMDRFEIARGVPRHLKIFAVRDMGKLLFGAAAPDVGADPTRPMQPGTWLTYLGDLAIAAGHQVPASAGNPRTRHDLAWAAVLRGIADKLDRDADRVSPRLQPVVKAVSGQLKAEYEKVRKPRGAQ
jgi:hypothetical protein